MTDTTRHGSRKQTDGGTAKFDPHRGWFYYLRLLLIALALSLLIKESVIEAYKIPSESMVSTLLVGDFLLANKFLYGARIPFTNWNLPAVREPETRDVVVFKFPADKKRNYIKRIVAVGGDVVEIVNKQVFVNAIPLEESKYVSYADMIVIPDGKGLPRDNFGPVIVPQGEFFMLGDNRDNSTDSRYWGCVPRDHILGKAFLIHWSWQEIENSPKTAVANPLSFVKYFAYHVTHLPEHVRWRRIFSAVN